MSINLEKHREKIVSAWKDVINDKTSTDWALFGYEGQTNDLKVIGSGSGGLDELLDDLNSGKIMYAFAKLADPKTGLNKFLLINWQGEGAQTIRKGTCANHIRDVEKILTGAHLTLSARVEDDIDKERILKKLSSITSAYNFKEPRTVQDEQKTPIGTNYSRIVPTKELNTTEMQNFWKKEEEEERRRLEVEQERKRLELIKREEEQRSREEKEHTERERYIAENNKLQSAHVPIKTSPQPLSPEKTISSPTHVMTDAERMRQERSQEARDLIGSRVGTAKAIFTQNSSDGQMQTKTAAPAKPVRNSIAQRINALNNPQEDELKPSAGKIFSDVVREEPEIVKEELPVPPVIAEIVHTSTEKHIDETVNNLPDEFDENEDQYSTIKRSPHTKSNSVQSPDEANNPFIQTSKDFEKVASVPQIANDLIEQKNGKTNEPLLDSELISDDELLANGGLKARALYDYQAADGSEITFDPGDIITHIDRIDEGWWQGLGPDGSYGLFPANYVELIE